MAIGGNSETELDVEIIDLSSLERVCTKPADLDEGFSSLGAVGAFIEGRPIICGGKTGRDTCREYRFETQTWVTSSFFMLRRRQDSAGIAISNGSWLIIGGKETEDGGGALADSEILIERDE